MGVRIGTGLSSEPDPELAARDAAREASTALGDEPADVAVVFAAGDHLADPEATVTAVHDALDPPAMIGCGAGGVLGDGREVEDGTGIAVWAAALDGGVATPFHAEVDDVDDGLMVTGFPELEGAAAALLLPDPLSFPTDLLLRELATRAPAVPVLGGVASARGTSGEAALFLDGELVEGGAVGLRLDDVELLPCVSQGAAPLGPEMTVTAAEGGVIQHLAGRPALVRLQEAVEELGARERGLLAGGLLIGIVFEGGRPEYVQGDFLVRGIIDVDRESGAISVGMPVSEGQIVRLHARDAASAHRDLRSALALRRSALGGAAPAGALVFSCNGRGRSMFGVSDHDAGLVVDELAGAPSAGFFAAGEIGPVGGESFLHGFTTTVAIFP
jgi:small ligand-binding sensory domain FIST